MKKDSVTTPVTASPFYLFDLELSEHGIGCHTMLEAFPAAAYICDMHGHVRIFNHLAVNLFGRMPASGTDKWCMSLKTFSPNGRPLQPEEYPVARTIEQQRPYAGKAIIIEKPDGSRRMLEVNTSLLYNQRHQPVAVMCVARPPLTSSDWLATSV